MLESIAQILTVLCIVVPVTAVGLIWITLEAEVEDRPKPTFVQKDGEIKFIGYYTWSHANYYYQAIDGYRGKSISMYSDKIEIESY